MPDFIEDPLEPVNRGVWEVNRGLLAGVIEPTGRVYRKVVPRPVRGSITDFTRNITYPGRVVNHALQGRWEGAGDETKRFICNTTVGVGGFFDVASKWDMPKSDADFSQTFGTWGWKPQSYLMLPFLGPSDDRNLVGYAADKASEPWSYGVPYRYGSYVSSYNKITGRSEDALRISRSEFDSYALVKYAWTFASKDGPPDWSVTGPIDIPTMQTLGAVRVSYQNPDFLSNGRELRVRIPSTGKTLKFNYWLHPGTAPLVYISPGLSSHRLSLTTLSVAELLHRNGYSVVTTTSVFHPEFMENASTSPLPVYAPRDSRDLLVAMTEADRVLVSKYPQRFTNKRALVGLSMGGFLSLRLAAYENEADPGLLKFDRYLAINAPVDVVEGALCVDSFQEAPMAWPAAERQARLNNTLHKAAASGALIEKPGTLPPFDGIESKYLIGLTFRITLRDIIYSSQTRQNMGVVQAPLTKWRREEAYHEIMKYSYKDYFLKMAVPYYRSQGVSMNQLTREGNLRTHASRLRKQGKIRLITNRNDFLLPSRDLSWLKSTFKPSQLTVFPDGGHLGNLGAPPVQSAVLKAMDGLK
jgi:ABC-type transporter lipoprotein component MlaA/pimeloyl-ACP methyl ester carboxylesterase